MIGCGLCPRACPVDRTSVRGSCGAGDELVIGSIVIHRGEEPPLVTGAGSGALFFSGCPLKCSYCQNSQISHDGYGKTVSVGELARSLLLLQDRGCSNINLVSPTHYAHLIREGLSIAVSRGLGLPVMLNSGGYESVEALKLWHGHAQIFLMDLKYGDNGTGKLLSRVSDY
ncbi:radical SAM protein, partial [bacterium]|nr:radical SAM protein [bacterium]